MKKERCSDADKQRVAEVNTDIKLVTAEVEAHRLVLAWLLKKMPDDSGHRFLGRQANELEKINKAEHELVIDELDLLRSLALPLVDDDEHPQQPTPENI